MNIFKLDSVNYEIPDDGIALSNTSLSIKFFTDKSVDDIEKSLGDTSTIDVYDQDGKLIMGTYKGYTVLQSIKKDLNVKKDDGTTATAVTVTLYKPSLEETVAQNTADITAINEAIADLASSVGGE
ncbi:MAG: hypothetical protein PUA69_02080 [Erysipelotrichaceae bacterium]|nr:hypothetical protein [Lactimicrobium massiliense]MDD6258032.1 hypothetical protein [Erysipelotrichaceae bacterium]MDD6561355.1 hypothetical protein [Lactimicrobium massiliense]